MFAKEDFEEVGSPLSSCYGCGKPILDRFLLTVLEKEGHQFDSCERYTTKSGRKYIAHNQLKL
jgi:hypothetical protein